MFLSTVFAFGVIVVVAVPDCTAALLNLLNVGFKVEMLAVLADAASDVALIETSF